MEFLPGSYAAVVDIVAVRIRTDDSNAVVAVAVSRSVPLQTDVIKVDRVTNFGMDSMIGELGSLFMIDDSYTQ